MSGYSAEWIKIPDGNGGFTKFWIRDSQARRDIAQLQTDVSGLVIPGPSSASPQMDGTAAAGVSADYSRADHVHPSDTGKQDSLSQTQLDACNSGITAAKVSGYDSRIDFFGVPTVIPNNADLNDYTTPGHYAANTGTAAGTLSNCPVSVNFSLFVIYRTETLLSQILIASNRYFYLRYASSSGWDSWYRFTGTAI